MTNKLFKNYISFFISLFMIEIIFRLVSNIPIFDWAVFRIFISSNIIALFISIILLFIKEKIGKIISIILMFVLMFYAILQAGFENFLGVYVSIKSSSQLGAVEEFISVYFASFKIYFWLITIPFILYIIYKLYFEKRLFKLPDNDLKSIIIKHQKPLIISLISVFILSILYIGTLNFSFMHNSLQVETPKDLFKNPTNTNVSVNQFGTSMFGLLDLKSTIIKQEDEFIDFGTNKDQPLIEYNYAREINDDNWIKLDNETTNKTYKTLNSYFMNREITPKNDYTGMFEGKNLIVILMESVNEIFINPEYYPTFYKMYSEGLSFTNNYSPRNTCATINNEMSEMLSLFSIYNTCTPNVYKNNEYFESIFGLFNKAGYKTSSYHNYDETFYYRSTIHKNMGSSAYYGVKDLEISYKLDYGEWPSDIQLMEKAFEHIDTTNPFMAFMTTVTSHNPYYSSSLLGDKHIDLFKDTEYNMGTKRYMSKLKELDLALERLLNILEEKDILKDTVIVLSGDHYPYALNENDIESVLPKSLERNNIDKTPFVIYNSEMEAETFNMYTSYLNILPTIANLFDLDYDPRLYIGEDVLNDEYINSSTNKVIFADGSWENNIAYYDATKGSITYFGDEKYTNEEIIAFNKEINNMIKMSNLAITSNYFTYLDEGLKKIENENLLSDDIKNERKD